MNAISAHPLSLSRSIRLATATAAACLLMGWVGTCAAAEPVYTESPDMKQLPQVIEAAMRGGPGQMPALRTCRFVGVPVVLSAGGIKGFVVTTVKGCGGSPSAGPTWVVRDIPGQLAIQAFGGTYAVQVLPDAHQSLQDLATTQVAGSAMVTTVWQFDGQHYQAVRRGSSTFAGK